MFMLHIWFITIFSSIFQGIIATFLHLPMDNSHFGYIIIIFKTLNIEWLCLMLWSTWFVDIILMFIAL
jgi:hypothetical protein